jgi:hypothetical protein
MDSTSGGSRADDESERDRTESTQSTNSGSEYATNFRKYPERYKIGRGESGVFKVQPYKGELLPLWEYADRTAADESGEAIYGKFLEYRDADDFVGMDMSRKYLQMGYTRSMRYARYPGGQKYDDDGKECEQQHWADHDKREAALIFEVWWNTVEDDETYKTQKETHRENHG